MTMKPKSTDLRMLSFCLALGLIYPILKNGADVAMFFYTVIETCKILGLNSRRFLKDQSIRFHEGLELQTLLTWARDG